MLRTLSLAVALFVFAGTAVADCGAEHSARDVMTPDQQANASQAPTSAKVTSVANKVAAAKHAKKPVDKRSSDKLAANKVKE